MTKEQAQEKYLELLKQKLEDEDEIMKEAKKTGTWKMGLDSNRDLFKESNNEFMKKVEQLKSMVDE